MTSSAAEPQVETLLSHYFHGINTHDYAEYASTLNPAQQAKQSQSTFNSGYVHDDRLGDDADRRWPAPASGLVATVTFTSHQSPAQSVDHSACNAWTLNLYLVPQGTRLPDRSRSVRLPADLLRLLTSVHGRTACRALGRGGLSASCSC